jgi:hypothetical protein
MSCTITVMQSHILPPPRAHTGKSPVRSGLAVVVHVVAPGVLTRVVRGLRLVVMARVRRGLAVRLHADCRGCVPGVERSFARLVKDDAGVDEKADEGGARESNMLAKG